MDSLRTKIIRIINSRIAILNSNTQLRGMNELLTQSAIVKELESLKTQIMNLNGYMEYAEELSMVERDFLESLLKEEAEK